MTQKSKNNKDCGNERKIEINKTNKQQKKERKKERKIDAIKERKHFQ